MKTEQNKYIHWVESDQPNWKKIIVESHMPDTLLPLRELSKNLWWVWNTKARNLFNQIDEKLWEECAHNPVLMLDEVSYKRFQELENDQQFLSEMNRVYDEFNRYMEERKNLAEPKIAYFSMEYGMHDSLKIFSGGLGMLAGDYLKEASDMKV
ncbi:MAG TPA: DUF3417 domain-containing protein, partial [Mariniphaga anaerophila]|nr:DUF3417 domain-containing protein [Mariniphaga anaerophila]